MDRNETLEKLSDDVRRGIPVSIAEAVDVIEYQHKRQKWRASLSWYKRLLIRANQHRQRRRRENDLADYFTKDNPRFDREKFLEASGL